MKLSKRQLKRIIREEKERLVNENYGSDGAEIDSLGALAYRLGEELLANEAYIRMVDGQIKRPDLQKLVEEAISILQRIDIERGL